MNHGPDEGGRRQAENTSVAVTEHFLGFLSSNQVELQHVLSSGHIPSGITESLVRLQLTAKDILVISGDLRCRHRFCDCMGGAELSEVPSLQLLQTLFSQRSSVQTDRIVQLSELLLSTQEAAPLASLLLVNTLYPAFDESPTVDALQCVVQAMRKKLSSRAFDAWSRLATDSIVWGYRSPLESVCPSVYMEAAQLPNGCFGSLHDSRVESRTVEILREFIPADREKRPTSVGYVVPERFWDGFAYDAQKRIVHSFDIHRDIVPWFKGLVHEVRNGFDACSKLCSNYRSDFLEERWRPESYWRQLSDGIASRFDSAATELSEISRVTAIIIEHVLQEQQTPGKQEKLRSRLHKSIGEDIVSVTTRLCACLSESEFGLHLSTPLTLALTELVEKLELPLDFLMEDAEFTEQASFYNCHLLPCFRHVLAKGDLQSALNVRRLFPEEVSSGGRRDTIDRYIDDNQSEMIEGLHAASRRIVRYWELGPDHEAEIESFRSALLYFVHAEAFDSHERGLQDSVARVVRGLVARDVGQHRAGFDSYWGCIKAGLIFQRLRKNSHLAESVANEVFGRTDPSLLRVFAACITACNRNEAEGMFRASITTMWEACRKFHDQLPSPNSVDHDGIAAMQMCIDVALQKWRGQQAEGVSVEGIFKYVDLVLGARRHSQHRTRLDASKLEQKDPDDDRKAHRARLLERAERRFEDTGDSLSVQSYPQHSKWLLSRCKAMLLNLDSGELTSQSFQMVFAELLVGLLWGRDGLGNRRRATMAGALSQMLGSSRGDSLCSNSVLRGALKQQLGDIYRVREGSPQELQEKLEAFLTASSIKELFKHWGYGSTEA